MMSSQTTQTHRLIWVFCVIMCVMEHFFFFLNFASILPTMLIFALCAVLSAVGQPVWYIGLDKVFLAHLSQRPRVCCGVHFPHAFTHWLVDSGETCL